jgi:quercetin dioxygenase-like cupin family protein
MGDAMTDPKSRQAGEAERGAGAARLADLVSYEDGSVVSRALIKKETGTVTLFAFDAGEGLSEHTAPFDALVYAVDGEADVSIDGAAHRVGPGDIITLPAHRPHAVRAPVRFKMLLIMVRA